MKTSFSLSLVALPFLAYSAPARVSKRTIITSPASVQGKTFDYVIAGGGLTGLTVASRLTENSTISVLVIEGGNDDHNDPRVYDPTQYGVAFGSSLDYNMSSTPISWRDGKILNMVAGKTLGGSGSINGASWTKGPKTQYDLLPYLTGDDSWGWDAFNADMLSAEHFNVPSSTLEAKGANYEAAYHGESGNVQVSFAKGIFGNFQLQSLSASEVVWPGLKLVDDVASGTVNGATTIANMIQPDASENRSSPYTAWIEGAAQTRSNLVILTGHRVTRIEWKDSTGVLTASGVEFQASRTGTKYTVNAGREVLLAAGSMQSPQLLELSGVGDPAVLAAAGVPLKLSQLGVGKNLQEQTKNTLEYVPASSNFSGEGPGSALAYPNLRQVLGSNLSSAYTTTMGGLPAHAAKLKADGLVASENSTLAILQKQVYNLFNQTEAAVEIFYWMSVGSNIVANDLWNLIPLSRGTCHIKTDNSWDHPTINPSYFGHPLDLQIQTMAAMQSRQVHQTKPLSSLIELETQPGLSTIPQDASYGVWEDWVKNSFTSVWHPIATLSMMKEEYGGVVDNRLKVYGISNVRVIDASTLPTQLSAHLSSSLYGIAEKAAAMIKADQ